MLIVGGQESAGSASGPYLEAEVVRDALEPLGILMRVQPSPHPALPPPPRGRRDRPHQMLPDRISPALDPRQGKDLLLDVGSKQVQVHDLRHPSRLTCAGRASCAVAASAERPARQQRGLFLASTTHQPGQMCRSRLGDEEACVSIDVSASGLSAIAHAAHARGDILPATLRYEDKQFTGDVCVQSIKALVTGDTRYGLTGLETGRGSIAQGQGRITMEVQRVQLRR